MTNINFDGFSHGQVKSKLWLCEHLEPFVEENSRVLILGSWINLLGFMMLTRNPTKYQSVTGIDLDSNSVDIANKICDCWNIEGIHQSIVQDANTMDMLQADVIINCSSEHMSDTHWFHNIPKNKLICIQSSSIADSGHPWFVTNPSESIEEFANKYSVSQTLFLGTLPITYESWGYSRYMLIGIK
jgi:hypothetical protein